MRNLTSILPAIFMFLSLAACSWMGFRSEHTEQRRSIASLKMPEDSAEYARDEESFGYQQVVDCTFTARGPVELVKNFKFRFDLEQLHQSSWAERVNLGNGLEVYVNLWSFREYTMGLREVRSLASNESRLSESKGVWSPSSERTVSDLGKIRFQTKLFHRNGAQTYEVRCPR
jgi:hypothetical protein